MARMRLGEGLISRFGCAYILSCFFGLIDRCGTSENFNVKLLQLNSRDDETIINVG